MHDAADIIPLIRQGGVYYNVSGETVDAIFSDVASQVILPASVDRKNFCSGLCERERLMTTAIGNGIAIPHPRTPLVQNEGDERVYVCFLDKPFDFGAMDGKPVFILFVILSSGSSSHLKVLSRLSWLFQKDAFREALRKKPDTEELISVIKKYSQGALS